MYSPIVSSIQSKSLISVSIEEEHDKSFEKCIVYLEKLTNEYTLPCKRSFYLNCLVLFKKQDLLYFCHFFLFKIWVFSFDYPFFNFRSDSNKSSVILLDI